MNYVKKILTNKLEEVEDCIELCQKNNNKKDIIQLKETRKQLQATLYVIKDLTEASNILNHLNKLKKTA